MNLISVYDRPDRYELLYNLLGERDPIVNISHKVRPSWAEHVSFVNSQPYEAWYFICDPDPLGSIYLTRQNEIGAFIFKRAQGLGYGPQAIKALMELHGPRRYLANVAPNNSKSQRLFTGMGFKMISHTYELVT